MPFEARIHEIAEILQTKPTQLGQARTPAEQFFRGVTTDSREILEHSLFIARKGEVTDGHNFLQEAASKKAGGAVVERTWLESNAGAEFVSSYNQNQPFTLFPVSDPTIALGDLARAWRRKLRCPVIAVCGSNGKTTTKEMLSSILRKVVGKGASSSKSFNNHVGLPQTILGASTDSKWLVLEAGMNHVGEMDYLGSVSEPDYIIFTNIGPEHIEFFEGLVGIADAECEILKYLQPKGFVIVFGDDRELESGLQRAENNFGRKFSRIRVGHSNESKTAKENNTKQIYEWLIAQIQNCGIDGSEFVAQQTSQMSSAISVKIPHLGSHNVVNALLSLAAAHAMFPQVELSKFASALGDTELAPMRLETTKIGNCVVINDAYNANPASMMAALKTGQDLIRENGSYAAVLGDMLELGKHAEDFHRELGAHAAKYGVKHLFAVGDFSQLVIESAGSHGLKGGLSYSSAEQAADALLSSEFYKDLLRDGGVLLVKGSRRIGLEKVVHKLKR